MLNQCNFIGNIGAKPEIRSTQSGASVANFRIAVTEKWKGADGQNNEVTEWITVVAWKRLAEICEEYLDKGSKVFVSGKMQTRKWQDNDGNDRYSTEIIAREMKMLSPKSESGGQSAGSNHGGRPAGQGGSGYDQGNTSYGPSGGAGNDVPF